MATNNKRLEVTEFDFDDVKENLKVFLGAQNEFTDYDFEGSGMSALLDVLAYNTHYLGFNANMLANEMFLDSASLRSSIVSHAKTLGYVPSSARAAKATVDVILNTNLLTATMPAGTVFSTIVGDTSFQFSTIESFVKSNTGNTIPFVGVDIYEGTFITTRYLVDSSDIDQRFLITDNRADTTTLTVVVQTSSTDSSSNTFTEATDITQVTSGSNVFFLQEVEAGLFEVYFGDGVIGNALSDDNIVILTYVVSNKTVANGASNFDNVSSIAGITDISVATSAVASAGSEPESLSSIKYNAPLDFASQGRCVTAEDYKVFAKRFFANTQAVQVFGGESGSFDTSLGVVSTPEFGKVFISIKSTTGNNLTTTEKSQLITSLAPFTVASITPVIVDVQTTKLILQVFFKFDSSKTTKTASTLESEISTTLSILNSNTLGQFEGVFRHSKVVGLIDDTDNSITGNITNVTMAHDLTPTIGTPTSYNISFNNEIYNPHLGHNFSGGGVISSTGFKISGDTVNDMFFDDNGSGVLRVYYLLAGVRVYQDATAGIVDYLAGSIVINNIDIISISDVDGAASSIIRITATPDSKDIVPVRNQILEIDFVNTTITGELDTVETGDSSAGTLYNTTSSYTTPSSF